MKKTNKGFSLVELIIVIAIMAILAGAIAPALIRYIDKSRRSNDVTAAKTIKTAVETALGNENFYEYLTAGTGTYSAVIEVNTGYKITAEGDTTGGDDKGGADKAVKITAGTSDTDLTKYETAAAAEIGTNIGETMPKFKFKKNASKKDSDSIPTAFVATVTSKGSVEVWIVCGETVGCDTNLAEKQGKDDGGSADPATAFQLAPTVSSYYQ